MSRPVCITYDSTCDLTPEMLERFRIRTVPLTIQSGERTFPDDGHYTSADLYADYRKDGILPKTAAVSPEEFKNFFRPILEEGFDIVHIDISSDLSSTCQNALMAAQELEELGEIHVVDSRQLSTGGGLLALQGAKLRDGGMAAGEIARQLRDLAPYSDTSFVLDTLEYMWKGGRCSGVAALGANVLKLKPCLEMREGKLVVCKKYRGTMDKVYRQYITQRGKQTGERGGGADAAGADRAGEGAGAVPGGVRHPGGVHRFLPLRAGDFGYPVSAQGLTDIPI